MSRRVHWIALGVGLLLLSIVAGLLVGPVHIAPGDVLRWLGSFGNPPPGMSEQQAAILGNLRLPRVIVAALVGASLSASGAAYQAVFRNPLADPYLLGAAAGAGLGATIAVVFGPSTAFALTVPLAAFIGAVAGVGMAYGLGRSSLGGRSSTSLVLGGIAVASFLTAVQTFIQQQNAETLRQVYSWILGRLGTTGWDDVRIALPSVVVAVSILWLVRRLLDVIEVGDLEAESLGLYVGRLRVVVVVAASLATAAAVSVAGLIGFVGIVVPHATRLLAGTSYRQVLPLSVLFGASFLILVDILARTAVAPAEVPIGVITAFVGAPFFVLALRRAGAAIGVKLRPEEDPVALEASGVGVRLGGQEILRDVAFEVPAGSWVCAIGPNGAGRDHPRAHGGRPDPLRWPCRPVGPRAAGLLQSRASTPRGPRAAKPVIPEGIRVEEYVLLGRTRRTSASWERSGRRMRWRWRSRSSNSSSDGRPGDASTRCPAVSCSGRCSLERSPRRRRCCSSTSRRPGSISVIESASSSWSTGSDARTA